MALINRPLTTGEVRKILADFWGSPMEKIPYVVHYRATEGVHCIKPTEFFIGRNRPMPSDCDWIVPGTGQ